VILKRVRKTDWLLLLGLVFLSIFGVVTWQDHRSARAATVRAKAQVERLEQRSIDRSEQLQQKLIAIKSVEERIALDAYKPAMWLSSLKLKDESGVSTAIRARVLDDSIQVLGVHDEQQLLLVPIEISLDVDTYASGAAAVALLTEKLGAHTGVDNCRLASVSGREVNQLRCRLHKLAVRELNS